ncbi:hypothetical protein EHM92_07265 [bacterium]|nr:MAG: hypothetical protein EHM92_07265 [bacterium]
MERFKTRIVPDPQEEIIERYCAEARRMLDRAGSREEALAVRVRLCSQLAQECESTLILDATQSYVDRVIHSMWSDPGKGTA